MRASALLLLAAAAAGPPPEAVISDPWFRALAPGLPASGYFTLSNSTDRTLHLTAAASPGCGSLTLHRTVSMAAPGSGSMGTMSMMQPVPIVDIPPHGGIRFAPGGYHLMCDPARDTLRPGANVPVTLTVDGSAIRAAFKVRDARGQSE